MNPRQMHYETLAGTIIKNLARRRMEGYYCATVEDAEKMAFSFLISFSKDPSILSAARKMSSDTPHELCYTIHSYDYHLRRHHYEPKTNAL